VMRERFSLHVAKAVVLQIGHRFFCISHCMMQLLWNSCPQSSKPILCPSAYSSYDHGRASKIKYQHQKKSDIILYHTSRIGHSSYLTDTARFEIGRRLCHERHVKSLFHKLINHIFTQSSAYVSYSLLQCQQFLQFMLK
jgi:hypothetical protein